MKWRFPRWHRPKAPEPSPAPTAPRRWRIKDAAIAQASGDGHTGFELTPLVGARRMHVSEPFTPAKSAVKDQSMAMDDQVTSYLAGLNGFGLGGGVGFVGYNLLAELAQRPEYRRGYETMAREMTRRFIKLTYAGEKEEEPAEEDDDDPAAQPGQQTPPQAESEQQDQPEGAAPKDKTRDLEDGDRFVYRKARKPGIGHNGGPSGPKSDEIDEKLKAIEAEFKRLRLRDVFRRVAELDGCFGRGHIYIDTGDTENEDELKTPLIADKRKLGRKRVKRLIVVEPTWSYPQDYNSRDPLNPTFFQPQSWLVMAKKVHASRLLTFVGREVPDILKPAYSFGGLSMIQMAQPYVDNWLRTRQSVSDLLHSFTVWGVKTDMQALLSGADDGDQLIKRAQLFNKARDNRGLMMIDKEAEDFFNISVPLSSLDRLQAQAQEQMASVFAIPLVVLLGITPSGLNASSDGEIRVFYDYIAAFQQHLFAHALEKILKLVQLSLFREIDEDIGFEFLPLWQPTETDKASIKKTEMETATGYVNAGVIDPEEVRNVLANDKEGQFAGIDVSDVPDDPNALPPGMNPITGEIDDSPGDDDEGDDFPPSSGSGARDPKPPQAGGSPKPPNPKAPDAKPRRVGEDKAEWKESDHPRRDDGKFGAGSGGSSAQAKPASSKKDGAQAAATQPVPKRDRPPFSPDEIADLPHSNDVRQPATSWTELQEKGDVGRRQFEEALKPVTELLKLRTDIALPEHLTDEDLDGGDNFLFVAPNKSEARARQKVENDYKGDWSKLKDMIRGSITVSSMDELRDAVLAVEAAGLKIAAKPKDKFTTPTAEGYRDLNTLMELPNGMLAELQFHLTPIIAAKNEAHDYYAIQQELQRKNGSEEPHEGWSDRDRVKFERMRALQRELYGKAWEKATTAG